MKLAVKAVTLCVLMLWAAAAGAPPAEKALRMKESELELLRQYLDAARDSLQYETTVRYTLRQQAVAQRETDREEFDRMRERQERLSADCARLNEEALSREQRLQEERAEVQRASGEWAFVRSSFEELLSREAERLNEAFPLDREARRAELEEIRRKFVRDKNITASLVDFRAYWQRWFLLGDSIFIAHDEALPDEGAAVRLTIMRLGNVCAYGATDSTPAAYYTIRQTGRLGAERYALERIDAPELAGFLASAFPAWVDSGVGARGIMLEVMQNDQSRALITGAQVRKADALKKWFASGGPVMVPLALMTLWAVALLILKMATFARMHRTGGSFYRELLRLLEKKDIGGAQKLAASRKGAVARVAQTCLEHSRWSRDSAEKAIREILAKEVPVLGRHLNSMAVIASAAPMLGLLGTVTGMISLFEVITQYGTGDPKLLAGGISEALVTTEAGLIIAVPVVLLHNYLRNRKESIQSEMEKHAISILNKLWP